MKGYEDIVKDILEVPVTFLPALFIKVYEECLKRKVFKDHAAGHVVLDRVEKRWRETNGS